MKFCEDTKAQSLPVAIPLIVYVLNSKFLFNFPVMSGMVV